MLWSIKNLKLSLKKRRSPLEVRNKRLKLRKTKLSEIDKFKQKLSMIESNNSNKINLFKMLKTIYSSLQVSKWYIRKEIMMILLTSLLISRLLSSIYLELLTLELILIYIIKKINKENSKKWMNNHKFYRD